MGWKVSNIILENHRLKEKIELLEAKLDLAVRLQKTDEERFKTLAQIISELPNVEKIDCDNCEGMGCCGCEGLGFTVKNNESV